MFHNIVKAGPIVGIVSALFVVILVVLYYCRRRSLVAQKERLKNMYARHVIDSLGIGKGASADYLTMEVLQEEFNVIDDGEEGGDGKISKAVSVQKLFCYDLLVLLGFAFSASCYHITRRVACF